MPQPDGPCLPPDVIRIDYVSCEDGFPDYAYALPGSGGPVWIVNLHGHGSCGDQLYTRPDIRDRWLPMFRGTGAGILTPNLRNNNWMGPKAAADLHALLATVRQRFDARRFIFFSGSMGGTGNLIYGVLHPEDVAAVCALCPATDLSGYHAWCAASDIPICGEISDAITAAYGGAPQERKPVYDRHSTRKNTERLTMPVFVSHGSADQLIPVEESRRLAAILGARLAYEEMPGGDHDSPLDSAAALAWLRDQVARLSCS